MFSSKYKKYKAQQAKLRKAMKNSNALNIQAMQNAQGNYANMVWVDPQTGQPSTVPAPNTSRTGTNITSPYYPPSQTTTSVGSGWGNWMNPWSKKEKEVLAKIGFEFDKVTGRWKLQLIAQIEIEEKDLPEIIGDTDRPCKLAVEKIKELKKAIIKKLTAKAVLAELLAPKEVKG
jgi:hypothetical protein